MNFFFQLTGNLYASDQELYEFVYRLKFQYSQPFVFFCALLNTGWPISHATEVKIEYLN